MFFSAISLATPARLCTMLLGYMGVLVVPLTLAMCLKTYGHKKFSTPGYMLFTVIFGASSLSAIVNPCPRTLFQTWIISHAFALVRILVNLLWYLQTKTNIGQRYLSHYFCYDISTYTASTASIFFSYGYKSSVQYAVALIMITVFSHFMYDAMGFASIRKDHLFESYCYLGDSGKAKRIKSIDRLSGVRTNKSLTHT